MMSATMHLRRQAHRALTTSCFRGSSEVILASRPLVTPTSSRASSRFAATRRSLSAVPSSDDRPLIPGIGRGKTSTGLVGLAVDHDAVPKMIIKYQALLDKIAASDMPPDAQYRINVEKIARHRISAATENIDDPEKVEELCDCGQVEELVIQADNEMIVLDMYLKNRWWEHVKPIEIDYDPVGEDGGHGDVEWGDAPADGKK